MMRYRRPIRFARAVLAFFLSAEFCAGAALGIAYGTYETSQVFVQAGAYAAQFVK